MKKLFLLKKIRPDFLGPDDYCLVYQSQRARNCRISFCPEKGLRLILPYFIKNKEEVIGDLLKENQVWIKKRFLKIKLSKRQKPRLSEAKKSRLKDLAKERITKRTIELARSHSFEFNKISIRNQKRRWGSCGAQKNLSFNWRLVLLPKGLQDYVIYHELVHLKKRGHQKNFWNELGKLCPLALNYRKDLRKYEYLFRQ